MVLLTANVKNMTDRRGIYCLRAAAHHRHWLPELTAESGSPITTVQLFN